MPIAFIFLLAVAAGVAVISTSAFVSRPQPIATAHNAQAAWFTTYERAAQTFAKNNNGFAGQITDAQLSQYMGPWSNLLGANGVFSQNGIQYGAAVMGGHLVVWTSPPSNASGSVLIPGLKTQLSGDLSGIYVKQGNTLVNQFDGQIVAAPF